MLWQPSVTSAAWVCCVQTHCTHIWGLTVPERLLWNKMSYPEDHSRDPFALTKGLLTRSPGISFYRPFSLRFLAIKHWPVFHTSVDSNVNCWCLVSCVIWVYIVWTSKSTELLCSSFPFSVCSIKSLIWSQEVISRISLRFILLYYAFPARQRSLGLSQNYLVVLPKKAYMKPSSSTEILWWKPVLKFNSRDVYLLFFLYRTLVDGTHHLFVKQYSVK